LGDVAAQCPEPVLERPRAGVDYDGDFNVTEYQSITYSHDVEDHLVGGTIQAINDRPGRCGSEFTGEQRKHVE